MIKEKILVVDDEEEICNLIKRALTKEGYEIQIKTNPKDIEKDILKKFDLILLDVMMPEIDGFSLCREIRDIVDCPIIFITAKGLEKDIVEGLSIGGDDYIKKPFSIVELRARVKAHIRRERREINNGLCIDDFRFNLKGKELYLKDEKIRLTKGEYSICEYLAKNKGQVFSLEQIFVEIYGYDKESDNSAVREHIKNIRAKLKKKDKNPINTVWGIGYKWEG